MTDKKYTFEFTGKEVEYICSALYDFSWKKSEKFTHVPHPVIAELKSRIHREKEKQFWEGSLNGRKNNRN